MCCLGEMVVFSSQRLLSARHDVTIVGRVGEWCGRVQVSANESTGHAVGKGAWGPTVLHMFLSFWIVLLFVDYKLTPSDQVQFTPQLRVSVSDLR